MQTPGPGGTRRDPRSRTAGRGRAGCPPAAAGENSPHDATNGPPYRGRTLPGAARLTARHRRDTSHDTPARAPAGIASPHRTAPARTASNAPRHPAPHPPPTCRRRPGGTPLISGRPQKPPPRPWPRPRQANEAAPEATAPPPTDKRSHPPTPGPRTRQASEVAPEATAPHPTDKRRRPTPWPRPRQTSEAPEARLCISAGPGSHPEPRSRTRPRVAPPAPPPAHTAPKPPPRPSG